MTQAKTPESKVTRAPRGYSRTMPAVGGGTVLPPCYLQKYRVDSRSENGIWWLRVWTFRICFRIVYVMSLMTSQVGSKVKLLIFCPCWLRRAKQSYQTEIRPRNGMDRVWDTSKYLLSLLWPYVKWRSSKVTRSKKTLKILSLDGVIHAFRSDLRQEHKKWL